MSAAPGVRLTLDDIDRFLAQPDEGGAADHYHQAAAVLATFDPFELVPLGPPPESDERESLLLGCELVTEGPERGLWSLSFPLRREALRALATRARMREALEANPTRRLSPQQRMFERVLDPAPIDLAELSRDDLASLATVHTWVDGILDGLPDPAAIRVAIVRADLLAPMQRLAGSGFVGRRDELRQLQDYVDGPPPPAPLYVFGLGGTGKSTLLARFVLAQLIPAGDAIVYIDVDRPTIRPDVPLTLLLDAIAQLQAQLDLPAAEVDGLRKEIHFTIGRAEPGRALESLGAFDYAWVLQQAAEQVARWLEGRRAVFIVDTLEEAQFLGSDVMSSLVEFLFALARALAGLRLILSGRALPREYAEKAFPDLVLPLQDGVPDDPALLEQVPLPHRPINLGELDDPSAHKLLRQSLREAGLPSLKPGELDDVIGIVTRNPMCLRLAARLLRDEGVEKLRSARTELLTKLRAEKIQALLYGRILSHVHGNTVKVAYPGLVVRRITEDVIREVLAGPCDLDLTGPENEQAVFDELRKEAALVYVDPHDGSLRHRADVRRAMLGDLTDRVDEAVVEAIDRGAVGFYAGEAGDVARAEEIYHRLRLREQDQELDPRWVPGAAIHLRGAVEELPAQQRLWLASRLGVTLDPSVRREASQEAWEDQAARTVERFLNARSPGPALGVLQERSERLPRSRLYTLEAETYRFLERPDDALRVGRAGVESASGAGAIDMALELLLKMVVIEEGRGDPGAAEALLDEAAAVADHSANDLLGLRVKVTRMRLQRQLRPAAREERAALRHDALSDITDETLHTLRAQPVLLREVAAELGKQDARIASAAIQTLGIEAATDAQAHAFAQAVLALNKTETDPEFDHTIATAAAHFEKAELNPGVIRKWVAEDLTSTATRRLGSVLSGGEVGSDVLGKFRQYFRAGVDSSLRGELL